MTELEKIARAIETLLISAQQSVDAMKKDETGLMFNTHKRMADDELLAIAALREKQERLDPRPLALDELRRMNGEPVWVRFGTGVENWMLIELEEYQDETKPPYIYLHGVDVKGDGQEYTEEPDPDFYELGNTNGRFGLFTLGWVAYRTKPERGREDA